MLQPQVVKTCSIHGEFTVDFNQNTCPRMLIVGFLCGVCGGVEEHTENCDEKFEPIWGDVCGQTLQYPLDTFLV